MLAAFANLPRPIQFVAVGGAGAGVVSVGMAFFDRQNPFWKILAIGIIVVFLLVVLYVLFLKFKDKAKSGPFASLIAKAGSGRGAVDPAQKARMDDLRKKFEEGVTTFRSAGKDLYSLPWFLLVGPSGSGKTEAMRHCNVGFPPGLQDCLQGTGGTMNMHWWFTNNAVVLDTAGRMFMEEGAEGGSTEWKEFMKLLKDCRPNALINGLLLVISSESLLKDSSEKIEKTAGAIARQLDVVQRTLDVRFPVFVVVTKCDKIVGFREFFETLNDPQLQHQMLGWSNPAPLDEAFKPDQVDKHLDTVRQRLMKRRMGLLQNPVHTTDPNARRTDQVDEMFELPDNLVRIAPRLRRYLEMIFVAGEWSPKPLFLRGIYFTSSMREGQALDMTLASALGIDVDSIPGGKEWDKDKAYFLRDVFLGKVFKEKGLVTRAVNVNKALAKQRRLLVGGSLGAVALLTIVAVFGWFSFKDSLGPPSTFWSRVRVAYAGDEAGDVNPMDISLVKASADGKGWVYKGTEDFPKKDILGDEVINPADLVNESARWAQREIKPPLIAAPIVGWSSTWTEEQVKAHRAVVERSIVVPLVQAARSKLTQEKVWGADAVGALAQLVRIQTYAFGVAPSNAAVDPKNAKAAHDAVDADVLFRYVLDDKRQYDAGKEKLIKSVQAAYPRGWGKDNPPSEALGGKDASSVMTVNAAVDKLVEHLLALGASPGSDMDNLNKLLNGLTTFRDEERKLLGLQWFKPGTEGAAPQSLGDYTQFESAFTERSDKIAKSRADVDAVSKVLGNAAGDPVALLGKAGESLQKELAFYFAMLKSQLPDAPTAPDAKPTGPTELSDLRAKLEVKSKDVDTAVRAKLEQMAGQVRELAPLMTAGHADRADARAYVARADSFKLAGDEVKAAATPPAAPEAGSTDLPLSLAGQIDEMDKKIGAVTQAIGAWSAWVPDKEQSPALNTDRDAAIGAAKKAVEIARGRKLYGLATKLLDSKDPAAWPQNPGAVAKRVADLASAKIGTGDYKKISRPRVPLSEMESGGEFAREDHPEAAKEVLNDWVKLRDLVEPAGQARPVVGREQLKSNPSYRVCAEATTDYAKQYIAYWRTQALETSRPNKQTWAEFGDKLKTTPNYEIKSELLALSEIVKSALASVPQSPAWADALTGAVNDKDVAFAGLDKGPFMDETKTTFNNWTQLVDQGPARARDMLLESLRSGKVKEKYFSVYNTGAGGLKYWNDLLTNGLNVLVKETQGDLVAAKAGLLTDAKGVPLALGPADMKDISPATLKKIKGWADKLDGLAAADKSAAGVESVPKELQPSMRTLAGADIFPDPNSGIWFGKLKSVLKAMSGDKPLGALVSHSPTADKPHRVGLVDDVRDNYKYACLRVGGMVRGGAFNLTLPIPPERQKDIRIDLPLAEGQVTEICLYKDSPDVAGNLANPDAKIVLPGPWSLVREIACGGDDVQRDEKSKLWRVLTTTGDGKMYLWMTLDFQEQDVPLLSDWPRVEQWPN
jgi:hypothetical protein